MLVLIAVIFTVSLHAIHVLVYSADEIALDCTVVCCIRLLL